MDTQHSRRIHGHGPIGRGSNSAQPSAATGGFVLSLVVRIVLLVLVLGQLVYLAGRYKFRKDLTQEKLYSLTDSTRRVLNNLKDRVIIEAWFSADDRLPQSLRGGRQGLKNFLDEYVQVSGGKVYVQYLDPQSDTELEKKAERLGIRPVPLQDQTDRSLSVTEVYQGMRFLYRGDRQKVVPTVQMLDSTFGYESMFTQVLKELTVEEKPKIGLLAFATEGSGQPNPFNPQPRRQPIGYELLKRIGEGRYEMSNVDLSDGKFVPDEIQALMLVRPKRLTDRQKYAIDQFVMRGGKLVVFADAGEVDIGEQRTFTYTEVPFDAADSRLKLVDMLAHYGARVENAVVADRTDQAHVPFLMPGRDSFGRVVPTPIVYPYWFRSLQVDWKEYADQFGERTAPLKAAAGGMSAAELSDQFRKTFQAGIDQEHVALKGLRQGPGMFWPCPVHVADRLPENVVARTLLRTSPLAWTERIEPGDIYYLNPLGGGESQRQAQLAYAEFTKRVDQRVRSEPRRQIGLAVHLKGAFPSFFAGRTIPPRRPVVKPPEASKDVLAEPLSSDPLKTDTQEGQEKSDDLIGPKAPEVAADDADKDPDPILLGKETEILVLGDSDFLRDDILNGTHAQRGGPFDQNHAGVLFFANLLDVLAEDSDLLELRNKFAPPRTLSFARRDDPNESLEAFSQRLRGTVNQVTWMNILIPPGVLMLIWLLVALQRRAQKQAFLDSTGN